MTRSIEEIVEDTLSGNTYMTAWCAVAETLSKNFPDWNKDNSKTPIENAVDCINLLGELGAPVVEQSNS
jgi:hypothetical protein